jgi:nucleoside phosphorylase
MAPRKQLTADAYTVGLVYVKPIEMHAITVMLDEIHQSFPMRLGDDNEYTLGKIGKHNVAIAGPPKGGQGKAVIADVVGRIRLTFKNIRVGLLVGIGGGVPRLPKKDVRLGDVVVGAPEAGPAVVQYDLGKQLTNDIEVTRTLNKPPALLLRVVNKVDDKYQRAEEGEGDFFTAHLYRFAKFPRMKERYRRPSLPDQLFSASYNHEDGTQCSSHDQRYEVERPDRELPGEIQVHYSTILSGDLVMKSGEKRDQISAKFYDALCFEMEAAGLMDVFPCLVIRGICNYSDSHNNKDWQGYAAATAAAYAREILLTMAERVVEELKDSLNGQSERYFLSLFRRI